MKRFTLWGLALVMVLGLCCASQPLLAQTITGNITGTVEDSAGAALNDATITASDTERGTAVTTKTTQGGVFTFSNLPIGTYEVKAEAAGFDTAVEPPITLVLNQVARLNFKMKVGAVTNTVEISSEAPQLQADTTQVSTLIDSNTITGIPLATRNYVELTLLSPGSVTVDNSTLNNGDNVNSGGRPYINGHREQSNNFILDGMDNNQTSENDLAVTPSPDSIQEFNVITANAPAEFGNFSGGIVNASIKSGTNQFHGDAWEFFRNNVLNANQWENKFLGPGAELPREALRWNMFGGTFGGPILKDKLFFFVDYQGQRFDHPTTNSNMTVFTNNERAGDFSQLTTQLKNPITGAPYPGNQIPIAQLNPVAAALFASSFYPKPINGNLTNNAINQTNSAFNADQGDAKVDWNITQKDRLSARYTQAYQNDPATNSQLILGNTYTKVPIHNTVGTWTHTLSPNILNEARVGASWITILSGSSFTPSIGDLGTELGIANANTVGPGLLLLGFDGGTAPSPGSSGTLTNVGNNIINQNFADTVIQFDDGVVVTHGKHVFKAGFQMWRFRINTFYSGNSGEYGSILFAGNFTGDPAGDFFTGFPEATGKGVSTGGTWHQFSWRFGGYGQDDWRITPTLTLNLGLRYEASTPWVELHNLQDNLNLTTGALEYAGVDGNSRSLYSSVYGLPDFQPRVGFAWSPANWGGKTVLRGAYTISSYLEGTGTNLRLPRNPPFTPSEVTATYLKPTYTTQEGPGGSVPGDPFAGAVMYVWAPKVQPAMDQQWNLTVQTEASRNTTFQVGYVGSHDTHLMVPTPYLQGTLNNGVVGPTLYFRDNPTLISDLSQVSGTASTGFTTYNALQAVLQKRASNGLQGQVAYTWSHCLTNNSGYYGTWGAATQGSPSSPYYQNLYNPHGDYASCYSDASSIVAAYATYDLPVGHGREFGNNMNPVANAVVGGWTASTIISLHTGFPLAVSTGTDSSGTNGRGPRPNCGQTETLGRSPSIVGGAFQGFQWESPNGYSVPPTGTFGTCPAEGPGRGPGYTDTDIGLVKAFHVTEARYFEFRGDFLNTFNNVQLGAPSVSFPSATFGLTSHSQPARQIQFALKFYF
jgi:hypothetical protein